MARIKHIAIRTGDVEKTATFYKEAFGLKQVGLGQNGIYLTDGHLNIAVLKFQSGDHGERVDLRSQCLLRIFYIDSANRHERLARSIAKLADAV